MRMEILFYVCFGSVDESRKSNVKISKEFSDYYR